MTDVIFTTLYYIARNLIGTIIIECLFGFLLGLNLREQKALLFCNLITNPTISAAVIAYRYFSGIAAPIYFILLLEAINVPFEAWLLSIQLKKSPKYLMYAFVLNFVSYTAGLMLLG